MNAFAAHFAFEFRTGIRNKNLLLMNYLFPLSVYLLLGFVMTGINPLFRDTMVPGMVTFAVLGAALLGLPDPLVNARETGIFRSYKINGVPALSILSLPALTTMLHLTVVMGLITATAPLLFDAPLPVNWAAYLLVFLVGAFCCAGLGVLIGVIAPSTRLTVLYSQLVFLPSMLIGGVMLPYSMLPETAARVARLLPATHMMNAFNGLAMGTGADFSAWGSVAALLVTGILAFALSRALFSWDSRNTTRRQPLLALLVVVPLAATVFLF